MSLILDGVYIMTSGVRTIGHQASNRFRVLGRGTHSVVSAVFSYGVAAITRLYRVNDVIARQVNSTRLLAEIRGSAITLSSYFTHDINLYSFTVFSA